VRAAGRQYVYGARGTRTPDLLGAIQALSQLSYSPVRAVGIDANGPRSVVAQRAPASAVWFEGAMGLLDEAIREHLELKRRSGADPCAIAREEQEALAPVPADDGAVGDGELARDDVEVVPPTARVSAAPPVEIAPEHGRLAGFSSIGQETAEIDMQAILDEDPDAADAGAPVGPIAVGPAAAAYTGEAPGDVDGVDWDLPSRRGSALNRRPFGGVVAPVA
jgi:hypothetical protein